LDSYTLQKLQIRLGRAGMPERLTTND